MGGRAPFRVRPARLADLDTLTAFNQAMAWESERIRLRPRVLRAGVKAVLTDPSKGRYLVAHRGGQVCGQLMVTFEWSDWRNGDWWWIQSVYVAPAFRRQGVFEALYRTVRTQARKAGVRGLRLYVERHNVRAKATYLAVGMKKARYELFELGEE